jgi:hypothetical protein
MTNTPRERHLVCLKLHSSASAVTQTTPGEIVVNHLQSDGNAGGKALHESDEFGAMRFTRCQPTQHVFILSRREGLLGRREPHRALHRLQYFPFSRNWLVGMSV